jgi:uncharacterized membrane protein YfcA
MEVFLTIFIILILCGLVAGFLAGLFGIGGGVIMVPVMFFLLSDLGYAEYAMAMSVATSAAVILPTALTGTIKYNRDTCFSFQPAIILGIGGIFGSMLGSTMSVLISNQAHVIAFSCFLVFLALWMAIKQSSFFFNFKIRESTITFIILGVGVGIAAGLFGVGGGVILTPVLTSLLGMNIHRSIGISLSSMVLIASGTVLSYIILGFDVSNLFPYSIGYVNILFTAVLVCASIPSVQLGVRTGKKMDERKLLILFISMLMILAIRMIFSV